MNLIQANKYWILALICGVCSVGAAVGVAQRDATSAVARSHAEALSATFREVSQEALPSIVSIRTRGKAFQARGGFDGSPLEDLFKEHPELRDRFRNPSSPEFRTPRGTGSGFVIDASGIIMTNNHVVEGAEEVTVRLHDGREFVAKDVKTDPRTDVAIIRIDAPADLKPIKLGDSDAMQIGDLVLAVGSPFGLDLTVTSGIISGKGRGPGIAEREDFLQTDAAINPGNSGGPLLNLDAEVIGINTAISSRSGGSDGIGFTIPINMAKWVAQQLKENGEVQRAYLGVGVQPIDNSLSQQLKVAVGEGAIVTQVLPDSPAAKAKVETGDVILSINATAIRGPRGLQGAVEQLPIGDKYELSVLRDGKRKTLTAKAESMPKSYSRSVLADRQTTPKPDKKSFDGLGIEVKELTSELAKRFGYASSGGVVVTEVKRNSAAQQTGINPGDVIEKVGTKKITSMKDFDAAMKDASWKKGVLLLLRDRSGTRFVVVRSK